MRNTIYTAVLCVFPCLFPFTSPAQTLENSTGSNQAIISSQVPSSLRQQEIIGTIVWLGINNNWNDAQNWNLPLYPGYGIPSSSTDVLIQNVASGIYPVVIKNQVAVCNTITINSGGPTLTIN